MESASLDDYARESSSRPKTLSGLILQSEGMDHRKFCARIMRIGLLPKTKTQGKRARTMAIKEQLKVAPDKRSLFERIPDFQLLPTEKRDNTEKFRKISSVTLEREGNLIMAMESWVTTAEQSNMSRKDFYSVLVRGETFGGDLLAKYDVMRGTGHFTNDKPQTSPNDVSYWARKILKWMANLITVIGRVPEITDVTVRLEKLVIDRSSREGVDKAWGEMRQMYTHMPKEQATPAIQFGNWKAKMTSSGSVYGKKWIKHMHDILREHEQCDWTISMLEAAHSTTNQFAGGSECTWQFDRPKKPGFSAATYAEVAGQTDPGPAIPPRTQPATGGGVSAPAPQTTEGECKHCYGVHAVPVLTKTRGTNCAHREAEVEGKYLNFPKTAGFIVGPHMRYLGRADRAAKFREGLNADPAYQSLSGPDRAVMDGRLTALARQISEYRGGRGGGGGRGRGGAAPTTPAAQTPVAQGTATQASAAQQVATAHQVVQIVQRVESQAGERDTYDDMPSLRYDSSSEDEGEPVQMVSTRRARDPHLPALIRGDRPEDDSVPPPLMGESDSDLDEEVVECEHGGEKAPGEDRPVVQPAPSKHDTRHLAGTARGAPNTEVKGPAFPSRTREYIAAAVPRPIRSRDAENLGVGKLTFVTSTVRAKGGSGVTIPIGLDSMSSVTTVSRALVKRMGWTESPLEREEWVYMATGLEEGGSATLRSTVLIEHALRGSNGVERARLHANHFVVERPTFDILIGTETLASWRAELSFRDDVMTIPGVLRMPTYDLPEAAKVVETLGDMGTRESVIWRQLTAKTRIASETKCYNCVGLSVGPESKWQTLRFQGDREELKGQTMYIQVVKDDSPKWVDLDKKERRCLDFRKVSVGEGRVELQVRNNVDYAIELSRGDIQVRATPTYRVLSFQDFDASDLSPEEPKKTVRFSAASVAGATPEDLRKYDHPPAVYPEEARALWHATSLLAKKKLYNWCESEDANPELQKTQLLELFTQLDIYDSDSPVDRGPWQGPDEELRVPEQFRRPRATQTNANTSPASELGGRDSTITTENFIASENSEEDASA